MQRTKYKGHFHYCYITINLINDKMYVGDHSTKRLDDDYMGSGTNLRKEFRRYGRKHFLRRILKFYPTRLEAHLAETEYIIKYNTLFPFGYNICPTGGLGNGGGCHSEETKQKMSIEVHQYDLNGNFLMSYQSITIAMKIIRLCNVRFQGGIEARCRTGEAFGGFYWSFKKMEKFIPANSMLVSQYNLDGMFLNTFKNGREAAKQTRTSYEGINKCINGILKSSGGYIWYQGQERKKEKPIYIRKRRKERPKGPIKRTRLLKVIKDNPIYFKRTETRARLFAERYGKLLESNESLGKRLLREKASEERILKEFTTVYKSKAGVTNKEFVAARAAIYMKNAKDKAKDR